MFGSSGKHGGRGRGGGGGRGGGAGAKRIRSPFVPPPPNRSLGNPSAASNRLSTGGGAAARNRHENSNPSVVPPTAPDETFSLVSHDPLSYAMIIRLTPDLVDEIKRVEAQGGTAQIKFDSNANNPSGNVIDVGGKDFRFTWSREVGDLCDIYEERRSGEDGNGLLVESGCPWRKLNVQRILDESTKNHVKMRSEEAELRRVSRKTVVLDHGSPSIKNQMKTSGPAVDFNPRRTNLKPKKEPPVKKRKVEPAQASIGSSLNYISGLSSAPPAKGRVPVPSPPQQPLASTSPRGSGNFAKALASIEVPQVSNKEITANSGKETPSRKVNAVRREISGTKKSAGATPKDLQSMLITLLLENPKGMSIKALEKAIGETVPNCTKKIEPIIKKIATYQAPGRYFLKPGVELENFKRPSPGSGSSPELAHDHTPLQESNLFDKQTAEEFEPQTQLSSRPEESNIIENIDIQQNSPDLIGDKKASDNSEGHASSSESGSDSDSESDSSDSGSESGSQSRSRSKSRSPAGSGSSSDSESDGSSSSKEGSDVDVDIMDDDKEEPEQKLQTDELRLSTPMPWRTPDDGPVQNGITVNKSEGRQSDAANGAADLHDDDEEIDVVDVTDTVPYESNTRSFQDSISFPADLNQTQDSQQMPFVRNVDAGQIMKDSPEQLDISNRVSKAKPKRGADQYQFDEKSESAKRLKAGGITQPPISGRSKETFYSENPQHLSLDRPDQDPNMDHNVHITNKVGKDGNADTSSQKGYGVAMPGKSVSDAQRPGHRSGDLGTRGKATDMERPIRYADNLARGSEHSERSPKVDKLDGSTSRTMHAYDKFSMSRDKHKEPHDEEGYAYDKSVGKNVREGDTGDKQSVLPNSHFRRHGEQVGKLNDVRQMGDSHMGSFPKDNSKTVPEKSLRREVSDLELGEFREAIPAEETRGVKKQFDRNNSFKSKNKSSAPDNNSDSVLTKGRVAGKTNQESRKQSPPNSRVGFSSNEESLFRKRTPEDDNEDSWMRPQQKASQSQAHQMPRVDRTDSEVGSQLNRSADIGIKSRKNGYGDTNKKGPVSVAQQHDAKNAGQSLVAAITRETKPRKSDAMADLNDRGKDSYWMEGNNSSRRRRESSSDEDNCSYLKYEKDEPELKGPIKDFSQYKEYVQEYREKYGSYCSLDKNLETYRNDFNKLGRDLEVAKGRDMERYYNILEQLKDNYRQCGTRHKRLKKIFIVLHEELKHLKQRINDFAIPYTRD